MLRNTLLILLFIFLISFGFGNNQIIEVKIFFNLFTVETQLYLLCFVAFVAGFILCYFLTSYKLIKLKYADYKQQREIKKLKKQQSSSTELSTND